MRRRRFWPRRSDGLPPGQRELDVMPRFADDPRRPPPPVPREITLELSYGSTRLQVDIEELVAIGVEDRTSDFHCVTTWSVRDLRWRGVAIADVLDLVDPTRSARFASAAGADGVAARFEIDDLRSPDVLIATHLDGRPLDVRHGAPLRLVCPGLYGYKNVKHLVRIELHDQLPAGVYGAKEHLRGRVAFEERHQRLPARLVRWPYRLAIGPTAWIAERTLTRSPTPNS